MKVLVAIPVPCDVRTFFRVVSAIAERWEEEHPGRTLTTRHWETADTEFGQAVVVWDEPLAAASGALGAGS